MSALVITGTGTAGAGRLGRAAFCRAAAEERGPSPGGHFGPAGFRKEHAVAKELT